MTNEQAAERRAKHECLMRELVEALESAHAFLTDSRIGMWAYMESDAFYSDLAGEVKKIEAILARAKEQQQ